MELSSDLNEFNICYQCGQVCEGNITYCHACFDLRSESDFRNEQRWRHSESDLQLVEGHLQKERSTTQRLEQVLQDFKEMLHRGLHADVTIETGEKETTPAHRAVLASRSPVFKAMFEHELKEKTCAVVRVADVPTPVMRALLLYLYTGDYDPKVMEEHGMALLAAAHKYDIPGLKRVCENAVASALQPFNALDTLQQARMYDSSWVKKACVECIAKNLKEVASTDEMRRLVFSGEDPEAVLEILQIVANISR